jgi:integrase
LRAPDVVCMPDLWVRISTISLRTFKSAAMTVIRFAAKFDQWRISVVGLISYWAQRLMAVRCFARYHSATDRRTQIPPLDLLRYRPRRARPYLYTEQDIERLMAAARALRPAGGLRGLTYATVLGLLSVTGLRMRSAVIEAGGHRLSGGSADDS